MSDEKPFHNPFAVLADLRRARPEAPPQVQETPRSPPGRIPRAVVRLERSGRGGKAVTVVDHVDLDAAERDRWLKALKAALGCGGSLEGNAFVLQGDQRDRLPALLRAHGVKRVTVA